ncbi:hypothetical protein [Pedobacter sp. BAL39]|uniref:hypothetical protein n=1 Tax=Pedobacter sp. BAL39 TaxID=391596 RepID=UPI000586AE5B|nr:hypothetical protein [Pedobacter sp. BAL39]
MIETSTSLNQFNHLEQKQDNLGPETIMEIDMNFYEQISKQLDSLKMNPSDDTIEKILAYSRSK